MINGFHNFVSVDLTNSGVAASLGNFVSRPYQWTFGGKTVEVTLISSWKTLFKDPSVKDLLKVVAAIILLVPSILLTLCIKGIACSQKDKNIKITAPITPNIEKALPPVAKKIVQPNKLQVAPETVELLNNLTVGKNEPLPTKIVTLPSELNELFQTDVEEVVAPVEMGPFIPHITLREHKSDGQVVTTDVILLQKNYGFQLIKMLSKLSSDSKLEVYLPRELRMPPDIAKMIVDTINDKCREFQLFGRTYYDSPKQFQEEAKQLSEKILASSKQSKTMSDLDAHIVLAAICVETVLPAMIVSYELQRHVANIKFALHGHHEEIPTAEEIFVSAQQEKHKPWIELLDRLLKVPEEREKQEAEFEAEWEKQRAEWAKRDAKWETEWEELQAKREAKQAAIEEERKELDITLKSRDETHKPLDLPIPREMLEQLLLMPLGAGTHEVDLPSDVLNHLMGLEPATPEEDAQLNSLRIDQMYADPIFQKLRKRVLEIPHLRAYFPTTMKTTPYIPQITLQERTKSGEVITTKIALQDGYIHQLLNTLGNMAHNSTLAVQVPEALGITQKMAEEIEQLIQRKYLQITA